jgi:DNA-binding MarR family transcriptional regulator
MSEILPLSALLSHAQVAFTIESDNEFEHRAPHRTTNHGSTAGSHHAPWLVSMVMWSKFLRFVPEQGISVQELQRLTQTDAKTLHTWLTRLSAWWGYLVVESPPGSRLKQDPAAVVRPTPGGQKAIEVWRPLTGIIEKRWQKRFGKSEIDLLRNCLGTITSQAEIELPDCLPILTYGLLSTAPGHERRSPEVAEAASLAALLAKALLLFAIEFERDSAVSLAISANILRLANDEGVSLRDLPRRAAVSKEAVAMSLSFLKSHGYTAPSKLLVLTQKGRLAREQYRQLAGAIEESWEKRFGKDTVRTLRESLERLAGDLSAQGSPLFRGLDTYPEGWRSSVPKPEGLPHYPMILHRGGFPDGS